MSRSNCERPCELNTLAAKLEGSHGFLTKDSDKIKDIEAALCAECLTEDDVRRIIEEYIGDSDCGLDEDYSGTGWYKATDTGIVYNKDIPEGETHTFDCDPTEYISVYTKEDAIAHAARAATSNITDMYMFFFREREFNEPIGHWDLSNVTNLGHMFREAEAFNQDISNWKTGNATKMDFMFFGAFEFNQDIGGWDTGNVTAMARMFANARSFNQDISGWDTSKVTGMDYMFGGALAMNQDLSVWCVTNIPTKPTNFDFNATSWTLPKPVWGTCP